MTEFILSLALAVAVLGGSAKLMAAEWNRVRCAYVTFEATHARLVGARPISDGGRVRISEAGDHVLGEGACGPALEHVVLPKIEASP